MKQPWYIWFFWCVALSPSLVVGLVLLILAAGGRGYVNAANVIVLVFSSIAVFLAARAMFMRGHLISGFASALLLLPLIFVLEQLHERALGLFAR
jgi:hypothetical protein